MQGPPLKEALAEQAAEGMSSVPDAHISDGW
jgi:hypothetical protein